MLSPSNIHHKKTMFDPEFYPTPRELAFDMIAPHIPSFQKWDKPMNILEPSAWSGAILDRIAWVSWFSRERTKLFAIEKSIDLQATLKGKWYKLIDTDFLSYKKDLDFDLIIMNPPFSNADDHFLKAWEIAENTDIVCLMNAETIRNPYSQKRQLVNQIIEDNGWSVEYREWAFTDAERKTGIDIAIVRVTKKTESARFSFDGMETEKIEMNEEILQNELATRDMIQNIIDDYARSRDMFAEWMKLIQKSALIASSITDNYNIKPFEIAGEGWSLNERYTHFVDELKYGIWNRIARELQIQKYMTSKLQTDFRTFIKEQWSLSITHENIRSFADMIFQNRWNILDNCILEVFDELTRYYKDNREYVEWWKTNEKWKVPKKFILPNWVETKWSGWFSINYWRTERMNDIDKALCYIEWLKFENIQSIQDSIEKSFKNWDGKAESTFFEIKYYLKWTVHMKWKSEELRKEFNMRACSWKAWLPEAEHDEWKKSRRQKETWIIII